MAAKADQEALRAALRVLYERNGDVGAAAQRVDEALRSLARKLSSWPDDWVEDAMGDVLTKALGTDVFWRDVDNCAGYLLTALENNLRSRNRRERRQASYDAEPEPAGPEQEEPQVLAPAQVDAIWEGLMSQVVQPIADRYLRKDYAASFPQDLRDLVAIHREQVSREELARQDLLRAGLDVEESALKSAITRRHQRETRARKKLDECLEKLVADGVLAKEDEEQARRLVADVLRTRRPKQPKESVSSRRSRASRVG